MGIKKYAPYRKEKERWDHKRGERLKEFKTKVKGKVPNVDDVGAIFGGAHDGGDRKEKKRKGKKERMKEKAAKDGGDVEEDRVQNKGANGAVTGEGKSHKKEGKRKRGEGEEAVTHADASGHLDEESEQAKKKRRRHKKSGKGDGVEVKVS